MSSGIDFYHMRQHMIKAQLQPQHVIDSVILKAFEKVPRELFLEPKMHFQSYYDTDIEMSTDQPKRFLISPRKLSKLFNLVDFSTSPKILLIGFATGYSLALAYEMGAKVYGIEEDNLLYSFAQTALQNYFDTFYGVTNFDEELLIDHHPLAGGLLEHSLYDYIIIEGGIETLPSTLFDQLRPQGKIIGIHCHQHPMGVFSATKEGKMHIDSFESASILNGFHTQRRFAL